MKLVHLSDIHLYGQPILGRDPISNFRQALSHISLFHADADHVVITGDLSHDGSRESYVQLDDILKESALQGHLTPRLLLGNHDNRSNYMATFPDAWTCEGGFVQWFEETAAGRFIYLDTLLADSRAGHLCDTRMLWLEQVLEQAALDRVPVYLFMHHNPVKVQVRNADLVGLVQMDQFQRLVLKFRYTIQHIFFGHCHCTLSGSLHGVGYSAPRSTNHPSKLHHADSRGQAVRTAWQSDYQICIIETDCVLVHSINFQQKAVSNSPADGADTTGDMTDDWRLGCMASWDPSPESVTLF